MPVWGQFILGAAALVLAIGTLWRSVLRPGAKLISRTEEMLPLLQDLTSQLKDTPSVFTILKEIVAQFRTDHGSSLRDVVDRLDAAASDNRIAAEVLKVQVEAARQLAEADRQQLARLTALMDRLDAKVTLGAQTVARIELADAALAEHLAAAQERADATEPGGPPGEAADAASRSATEPEPTPEPDPA